MIINLQPIEKIEHYGEKDDGGLDIHSIFPTIQGEGPYVGQPAIFIRLAGCNLQCPLCDTEYTTGRQRLSVTGIFDAVQEHTRSFYKPLIVLTGGEPLRQRNLYALVKFLLFKSYRVQIETNGSVWQEHMPWDNDDLTVVCSPKTGKLHAKMWMVIDAYKYIIRAGDVDLSDGLPIHALDHSASPRVARPHPRIEKTQIYVQPCDLQDAKSNAESLQAAIKSCRDFGYTLCLQTHKMIGLP